MTKTQSPRTPNHGEHGFTLIELMIVVTIISVLLAVALPSYKAYVDRGHRAQARSQLLQAAQYMQRFYAANDRYDQDRGANPVFTIIPDRLKSPAGEGASQFYQIVDTGTYASSFSSTTFQLVISPIGGSRMEGDACGAFTLNHLGAKGNMNNTLSRDECWR